MDSISKTKFNNPVPTTLALVAISVVILFSATAEAAPRQHRLIASSCNYTRYINGGVRDLFYPDTDFPGFCEAPQNTLRKQVCCQCLVIEPNEVCRPGQAAPSSWTEAIALTNLEGLVRLNVQYNQPREYWFCCNKTWLLDQHFTYQDFWTRDILESEKGIHGNQVSTGSDPRRFIQDPLNEQDPGLVRPPVPAVVKATQRPTTTTTRSTTTSSTTTTPAAPTTKRVCQDLHTSCETWANSGYCQTNIWVHERCRISCDTCDINNVSPITRAVTTRRTTIKNTSATFGRQTRPTATDAPLDDSGPKGTFVPPTGSSNPESTTIARCSLAEKPQNRCRVGSDVPAMRWYFHPEHHECLAFWDVWCPDETHQMNRFDSWSQCNQRCKAADTPTCAANKAPATKNGHQVLCSIDSHCPTAHLCVRGAFFSTCCDQQNEELYAREYNPVCANGEHLERFEDHGAVHPLLGGTCADNFCSPASTCVQGDVYAHCCSKIRLATRRANEQGRFL